MDKISWLVIAVKKENPANTTDFFDTQTSKHLIIFKTILINKVVHIEKCLKENMISKTFIQ